MLQHIIADMISYRCLATGEMLFAGLTFVCGDHSHLAEPSMIVCHIAQDL